MNRRLHKDIKMCISLWLIYFLFEEQNRAFAFKCIQHDSLFGYLILPQLLLKYFVDIVLLFM